MRTRLKTREKHVGAGSPLFSDAGSTPAASTKSSLRLRGSRRRGAAAIVQDNIIFKDDRREKHARRKLFSQIDGQCADHRKASQRRTMVTEASVSSVKLLRIA